MRLRSSLVVPTVVLLAVSVAACGSSGEPGADMGASPPVVVAKRSTGGPVLRGRAERLTGGSTDLASFRGDVVLVVNTASECGFTPQFADLQKLYAGRHSRGFTILGFPSGSFNQELDSAQAIKDVCEKNFGVRFPMFAKTAVIGDEAHPLFKRLAAATGAAPSWNFNKYLVDRRGHVVGHFDSGDIPTAEIDRLLAQRS